ncbi:hypothetical protein G9A89_015486 [Geosiphon pyriformis]|nr:hypothetical protein G9A89_015486 [Geosiphon pyriformis]
MFGATFKIKLAYVKTVFQSVHGFLGAKSVSKDNVKLFCVEFASQVSLKTAFLVELTSSVHLATLKIAKFLVISESGFFFAAVALHDMPLGVSTANIKTAFSVFGSVTYVVLKPTGIWQYVVFTSYFVGPKSYAKASVLLGSSGFPPLSPLVFSPVLSALVEFIVKPVGFLVKLFEQFVNGDLVSSSKLGIKINEIMMHMGFFNKVVGKLGRKMISLKKECCMENIDMSGNLEHLVGLNDKVFSNLMSLWEHESIDVKTNDLKTAEWLVRLVPCSVTLFSIV